MRGDCPDCDPAVRLVLSTDGPREVATCRDCLGAWFGGEDPVLEGALELRTARTNARFAQGRCARGHGTSRDRETCDRCDARLIGCPACEAPLSRVITKGRGVEVCASCHGVWLRRAEADGVGRLDREALRPVGGLLSEGVRPQPRRSIDPFRCSRCETPVSMQDARASDGAVYCPKCWVKRLDAATQPRGLLSRWRSVWARITGRAAAAGQRR